MPEPIRRNLPMFLSVTPTVALIFVWVFSGGRLTGASSADMAALQERQARLEERQTKLETLVTDRLERIMAGQADLHTSVETLRTEVRVRFQQGR